MKKLVNAACLTGSLLVFILLAGCATGPTQYVPLPEHLNAAPAPGKARVCVIRGYVFFTGEAGVSYIDEDGRFMGNLINGSYICWERLPGVAQLSIRNLDNVYYRGNLPVEPGMVYYLFMDAMTPPLTSLTPAEGQKHLTKYPKPHVVIRNQPPASKAQTPSPAAPAGAQPSTSGAVPRNTGAGY
ncbi:MAG: hypothetical protein KMY53_06300 [Desulfarculus sp.]|nr:hypothetical protein [Pseudomonadota bacterium]MBV1716934.1 hypothetical protein [Desulfarculus sp.]MBU4574615.1 hypothetical protein [Pseudomonadota bacterium]MBU4596663.1 hypothetical protein [Pseudomonadota bacterium]MBV1737755.1 hypothetical protein [Desulfarculus sp.]